MSRHRFIRNIDIHDELDDDPHEYHDPFEGASQEDLRSLDNATAVVFGVIGRDSMVSEEEVRRTLWDSYFDTNGAVDWTTGGWYVRDSTGY